MRHLVVPCGHPNRIVGPFMAPTDGNLLLVVCLVARRPLAGSEFNSHRNLLVGSLCFLFRVVRAASSRAPFAPPACTVRAAIARPSSPPARRRHAASAPLLCGIHAVSAPLSRGHIRRQRSGHHRQSRRHHAVNSVVYNNVTTPGLVLLDLG